MVVVISHILDVTAMGMYYMGVKSRGVLKACMCCIYVQSQFIWWAQCIPIASVSLLYINSVLMVVMFLHAGR